MIESSGAGVQRLRTKGWNHLDDHRVFSALTSGVALPPASIQSVAGESLPREHSECFGYDFHGATAFTAGLNIDII
jgi:hypothetical protein